MSTIYLMRHAQSEGNLDTSLYATKGNENLELTPEGGKQASQAAKLIKSSINDRSVLGEDTSYNRMSIISSPFIRTMQTAKIITKEFNDQSIKTNVLLYERNHGEQEGCPNIDNFDERPIEREMYKKMGHLNYKPLRGESLMDVHTRAGIFMSQYAEFRHIPVTIIVSHRDLCHMLHAFLTGEMPTPASSWKNCEIRRYQVYLPSSLDNYEHMETLHYSPETSTA